MKIIMGFKSGRLTLHFIGELDHHGAKESMSKIDEFIDHYLPRDCVMELSGLSFMDSSGIAILLRVYRKMRELGGRVWIENPPPQPLRVIDASGIDRLIRIATVVKEGKK